MPIQHFQFGSVSHAKTTKIRIYERERERERERDYSFKGKSIPTGFLMPKFDFAENV